MNLKLFCTTHIANVDIGKFQIRRKSIRNLYHIVTENLKTLILTFVTPLEHCTLNEYKDVIKTLSRVQEKSGLFKVNQENENKF